jgi:hypothetical protein
MIDVALVPATETIAIPPPAVDARRLQGLRASVSRLIPRSIP